MAAATPVVLLSLHEQLRAARLEHMHFPFSERLQQDLPPLRLASGAIGGQATLIPGAWLAADLGRAGGGEPGLDQHPLRGDVLVRGRRLERVQAVLRRRQPAQFPDGRGRRAAACGLLRDPVTEYSRAA